MRRLVWMCAFLSLMALPAGCGLPLLRGAASGFPAGITRTYPQYGCTLSLPEGWVVVSEKERLGVLTVRAQDEEEQSSYMIATIFPAELYSPEEAVAQGERLLQSSLYALQGPVRREEITLRSGTVPLLAAEAGDKSRVEARTAVLRGRKAGALVTFLTGQDRFLEMAVLYEAILENVRLE